ncbi:MAG: hypothetical protein WC340_10135 [Kiritimatiellia bacterium]
MKKSTMMLLTSVLFTAGTMLQVSAAVPASINALVPGTMNYQGRLVDSGGAPYSDATYTFDIRLYKEANGGTPLWGGTFASFVKDGYFNIMLGGTGGQALPGTTYTHTDLWKALWPDVANGATDEPLYLGVTPWQSASGALIDPGSRTELSPRQTLLTAPYAFRSQTAEYANRASGDFIVGGRVTAGHITTTGDLLKTDGTTVNVGGAAGNITANTANVNAKTVNIKAGTSHLWVNSAGMIFTSASGGISFTTDGMLLMYPKGMLDLYSSNGLTKLRGKTGVQIESSTGDITLNPQTAVKGYDALKWTVPGGTVPGNPIGVYRVAVNMYAGQDTGTKTTSFTNDAYSVMIVGLQDIKSNTTLSGFYATQNLATKTWEIKLTRTGTLTNLDVVYVDILAITKNWISDPDQR